MPEKLYIGSKLILGIPMDELTFLKVFKGRDEKHETRAGYKVTYPDGYVSWSPKDVFENAYREVTQDEKDFMFPKGESEEQGNTEIHGHDIPEIHG